MTTAQPMFLTLRQAAKVTGVGVDTLRKHVHAGSLKAKTTARTGGKTLVRPADLEAWFSQLEDA